MCSSIDLAPSPAAGSCARGSAPGSGARFAGPSLDAPQGHPSETNQHATRIDPWAVDRENSARPHGSALSDSVHGRVLPERERIALALASVPDAPWRSRVARFTGCCQNPAAGITKAGAVGAVWFRCRDRLCPTCARVRSRQTAERVAVATQHADSLRFLTFTLKSSDAPLGEQLDRLYASLRSLRRTAEWKAHVWGGIACVEVTRNAETGQWHPHLHVLADGKYWRQASISNAWRAITGDSPVVDIRAVRSRKNAAQYVAKYSAKPTDLKFWPLHAIADFAAAIHRRRLVLTFGSLHGHKLDADDEPERRKVCGAHVPLAAIEIRAGLGCRLAKTVLASLAQQNASYARSLSHRSADERPDVPRADARRLARAPAAMRVLHRRWQQHPCEFTLSRRWPQSRPPLPTSPPCGRARDHTAPLDPSWVERPRRHW